MPSVPPPPDRRPLQSVAAIALALLLAACGRNLARADAYEALADQQVAVKAWPAAADSLTRATNYDSNEPRRWVKLGRVWRMMQNPALAARSYQRALDLEPANVEALENLAVLLVRAGRYDDAKEFVDPLLTLNPNDPGGLLASGAIAFFEKRLGDADRIANQLIQLAPDAGEGYVLRAHVMEARGQGVEAARMLEGRLKADPDNDDVAGQMMGLYQRARDLAGIRRAALVLARLQPDNNSMQMEAARALHAAGRDDEAEAKVGAVASKEPGSAGINVAVADYWIWAYPPDKAAAKIAALAAERHGRVRAALADRLIPLGRANDAIALLAPETKGPVATETIELHATEARALLAAGRWEDAERKAGQVLAYDGNDVAMVVRATVSLRKRRFGDALNDALRVTEDEPDNEDAALLVPQVYAAQGNQLLALKAWGDAQAKLPNSIRIVEARVAWLLSQGMKDDATNIAAQYARSHRYSDDAQAFARDTCAKVSSSACLAAAHAEKKPWNL